MSKNYSHARKGKTKRLAIVVASLLAASGLVGGVFAWNDFNQSRTNKFRGASSFDAEVTLHDEFAEAKEIDGLTLQKDVFVENTASKDIFVRVRLDEFMQVGAVPVLADTKIRDKDTWQPHLYGTSVTNAFSDYFTWSQSGMQRKFSQGIGGMVFTSLNKDTKKPDRISGTEDTMPAQTPVLLSEYVRFANEFKTLSAIAEATRTDAQKAALLAAKDYLDVPRWLLDDTTASSAAEAKNMGAGWAYWSKALEPGKATNLLLDSVAEIKEKIATIEEDWTYRIDVKLQAVTFNDLAKWHDKDSTVGYKRTQYADTLCSIWEAPTTPPITP